MPSSCGARGYGLLTALPGRWAWVAGTVLHDILGVQARGEACGSNYTSAKADPIFVLVTVSL